MKIKIYKNTKKKALQEMLYRSSDFEGDAKKRNNLRYQHQARHRISIWFRSAFGENGIARQLFRDIKFEAPSKKELKVRFLPRQGIPREKIEAFVNKSMFFKKIVNGFNKHKRLADPMGQRYFDAYSHFVFNHDIEVERDGKIIIDFEWNKRVADAEKQVAYGRTTAGEHSNWQKHTTVQHEPYVPPANEEEALARAVETIYRIRPTASDDAIRKFMKKANYEPPQIAKGLRMFKDIVARKKKRTMKESKTSALGKYISENKQLLKEDPYNTPEYDLQRRANSYLTSIAKEMYKVTKPFEEIKKLIDAIPEWVEKQMPDDAWNSLGDLHDLSKINFQKLEIDFNRTVGPGSEVEDTEGQENVAGATDSSLRESLFQEEEREVPTTGGGTQIIDLDTLSDDQRFRAYTILRQNNYEFTDIEQVDYMQMLDDKDPGTLTTGETNYILNNTTMSQETDLESEEAEEE